MLLCLMHDYNKKCHVLEEISDNATKGKASKAGGKAS